MPMKLSQVGEFGLIERLRHRLATTQNAVVGIGDDAAVLQPTRGHVLLVTADALVEDTHFRCSWISPDDLGWKSLACNLSDIAAMGGRPTHAVVSLALPPDLQVEFVEAMYRGMRTLAKAHGVGIVGGDLVKSPEALMISITVVGEARPAHVVLRSGAKVGDAILVTGALGASSAGLALLESGKPVPRALLPAARAHVRPTPRVQEGQVLGASGRVTSMIDVSDGLAGDLAHICEESRVGARVALERVPVAPACTAVTKMIGGDAIAMALSGGEDYELLFTCAPKDVERLTRLVKRTTGTAVTEIGHIVAARLGLRLVLRDGRSRDLRGGFKQF
jgi:thiamine-monophosphate kinase